MSEKFELEKKDMQMIAVLLFVGFLALMAGLSLSMAALSNLKRKNYLYDALFSQMKPGLTYLVRQRQDGVLEVNSACMYDVRTSCQVVTRSH